MGKVNRDIREHPDVTTADVWKDIESVANLSRDFDPCNSYFSVDKLSMVRRLLKKELCNDHLRNIGSDNIDDGLRVIANAC